MFSRIDYILHHKTDFSNLRGQKLYQVFFLPIVYETRNQLLIEKQKENKSVDTKQHATKETMGQ